MNHIKKISFIACVVLYAISCFLPCITTTKEELKGIQCLLLGWMSVLTDFWSFVIWGSNILYVYTIIMIVRKKKVSLLYPLSSFLLSITMIFHKYIIYDVPVPIQHLDIGYYLWCASFIMLCFAINHK